jgi:hypothetical protein
LITGGSEQTPDQKTMSNEELQELQDPANWDYEHAEKHPGVDAAGAVVNVAFAHDDFARLAAYAQRHGMTVTALIRAAALDKIAADTDNQA